MTNQELIQWYFDLGFRIITWPDEGELKGPEGPGASDWANRPETKPRYREGVRYGALLGVECKPGHFLVDIDIDWEPGRPIAQAFLPGTPFVFGRPSKLVSHCFYFTPEAIPTERYDERNLKKKFKNDATIGVTFIEIRGVKKSDGSIGHQTMIPPSVWQKGDKRERLIFAVPDKLGPPALVVDVGRLRQIVCLIAIGMLLAKSLGKNGFGHEVRLAWAGFLLRAGIPPEDLVKMGEAMSVVCNNLEIDDVRRTVESTEKALASPNSKKVKGGPALAQFIGDKGKLVIETINEWLGRESDFVRDSNGRIAAKNQANIKRSIELLNHKLTFNQFAYKELLDDRPLEQRSLQKLYLEIEREHRYSPPMEYFEMVVRDAAMDNPFHPVLDYLAGLRWDNVPRIERWMIEAGQVEDTPYVRAISAIMLVAAVRRVRLPGCKYDELVVWESGQGTNKSSAAQMLCPNPDWFSDDFPLNARSQQVIEATLGKWIIEASELAGKRRAEIEQLKSMLSRGTDGPARLAYERLPIERPRHFILIGTTNSTVYLTDATGARRFWPVSVKQFDLDWIRQNRDQLWAEAAVRESEGYSIRLPRELWPEAAVQQEARREIDPWEEAIRNALDDVEANSRGFKKITASELWDALKIPIDKRDRYGALRISDVMQRLGFSRRTVWGPDNKAASGYVQEREMPARQAEGDPMPEWDIERPADPGM